MTTFQQMIHDLSSYWAAHGCAVHQGYDLEVGAGTFNPTTFLRCLGPEPYSAVYVEPSRRPQDGRYGDNPNRVQFYHQMQVIFKPSPDHLQKLYLGSLEAIGLPLKEHDIRFVHDDWENPTIGASGLGWEVWADGMEVTQFTYFQTLGGLTVHPVSGELTYGLERLAMFVQNVDSIFDLKWNDYLNYGDIYKRSEWEWSHYNFSAADTSLWLRHFDDFEKEAIRLIKKKLPIPAYDFVMKASHAFNILDARGVISVTERTGYIGRIRNLAKQVAKSYIKSREEQSFPLLRHSPPPQEKSSPPYESLSFDAKKTQDFLLEIGSEELPSTFVPIGAASLKREISALLSKYQLAHTKISIFGTPRRLAVLVKDLVEGSETVTSEKKGPALAAAFDTSGQPTGAGKGFFRSLQLDPPSLSNIKEGKTPSISIKQIGDKDYLFARVVTEGQSTRSILAKELSKLILRIDFPKKMRWGVLDIEYARPLRWIVALLGKEEIPFSVASVTSGKVSQGHPVLCDELFALAHASDYVEACKNHKVLVDIEERKQSILSQIEAIEQQTNSSVLVRERVLPQVLHLTEWPQLEVASFDPTFLKAPREVLISEMVEHQKYFPVGSQEGALKPLFVITCNNTPNDLIIHGNQKALSPRLADGVFLYEQDLKIPLEKLNEKLKHTTYQKELGSVFAKIERLQAICILLHTHLPLADLDQIKRAATLCKADLASHLVGEFPELQGIAGSLYAKHQGEDPTMATAIEEHWMPRAEKAPLPQSGAGIILSFADKIDNFLSCFAIGLVPTSSSDPYALRRQAIGFIKSIIQGKHSLPLEKIFFLAFDIFLKNEALGPALKKELQENQKPILSAISTFFLARLKTVFLDYGFKKDEIEAAFSQGLKDIYESFKLTSALHQKRAELAPLLEIHTRARKILPKQKTPPLNHELFEQEAERVLFNQMSSIKKGLKTSSSYEEALSLVATLKEPLNIFFDSVKVFCDNDAVKQNRLSLLKEILHLTDQIADFSKIQI